MRAEGPRLAMDAGGPNGVPTLERLYRIPTPGRWNGVVINIILLFLGDYILF
jgi:hypothetical protein